MKKEDLVLLYDRVEQYCLNAFNYDGFIDSISIEPEGNIKVTWSYLSQYTDDDVEFIDFELLSEDLDELRRKRLEKEEVERVAKVERDRLEKIEKERRDKENRRNEYMKLKKEFE